MEIVGVVEASADGPGERASDRGLSAPADAHYHNDHRAMTIASRIGAVPGSVDQRIRARRCRAAVAPPPPIIVRIAIPAAASTAAVTSGCIEALVYALDCMTCPP